MNTRFDRIDRDPSGTSSDDEREEEGLVVGLRDLAQRNPTFFDAVIAGLRRGATAQQMLYIQALELRCKQVPRPCYREIAEPLGVPEGTLRVGVLRLREKAQYVILRQLHGRTRTELGEGEVAELRRAWREGLRAELEARLEALRAEHSEDANWRLYAGIAAFHGGRTEAGGLHWVFGRIVAQGPETRAKLLSNLGCVEHAAGRSDQACGHWLSAARLDPLSPFPLLNLAMHFVAAGDAFFWTWALKELSKLRSGAESCGVIDEFLAACPVFEKVSRTAAWRRGPAKWIREVEARRARVAIGLSLREISRRNPAGTEFSFRPRCAA